MEKKQTYDKMVGYHGIEFSDHSKRTKMFSRSKLK